MIGMEFAMLLLKSNGQCNICGKRIRLARKQAGLSQEQLAARLQLAGHALSQKAISRSEAGIRVIPDYEVPLFANALGVSPLWLLGIEGDGT